MKEKILQTPYGKINLASGYGRRKFKKLLAEIVPTTDALTKKDIADWRMAWQLALNVDSPNRQRLLDIYRDVMADAHLMGCITQRKGFVMSKRYNLKDKSGKEDEAATHQLEQGWFHDFCSLVLDSRYWGHSLIELGEVVRDGDGCLSYDGVTLIPRKHVIPEKHRVVRNLGEDWRTGLDYREAPWKSNLIEAGRSDDLGLLLLAALHTIPKKNMLAFWDSFGEIFGMPMRIAKTTSRDPKVLKELNDMLVKGASKLTMVSGMDTEIEFVETGKGDAFNVYDKRVDRCNSELSKLIIGQTMTIEDGSSLSQSETHLAVFENLVREDAQMLRDVVNNQLLPRMAAQGFKVKGLRFEWDEGVNYTPEAQLAYETMIADRYEVDGSYFAEKYNMPVGERREVYATGSPEEEEKEGAQGKLQNGLGGVDFFD